MLVVIQETIKNPYEGVIKVRELPPEWDTEEIFLRYWPQMTLRERDRYSVAEFHNLITTNGYLAINQFLGSAGTNLTFAKYLALGNGSISAPASGDTSLVNEVYRAIPNLTTIVSNTTDITTYTSSAQAQFVMTEAGLFTGSATGTANSGTLATHVLAPYDNTDAKPKAWDYIIIRN